MNYQQISRIVFVLSVIVVGVMRGNLQAQNSTQSNLWISGNLLVNQLNNVHQLEGMVKSNDHFVKQTNQFVLRYSYLRKVYPNWYFGGGLGVFDSYVNTVSTWRIEVRPFLQLNRNIKWNQWGIRMRYRSEFRLYSNQLSDTWRNRIQLYAVRRIKATPFYLLLADEGLISLKLPHFENRTLVGFQYEFSEHSLITLNYMLQMAPEISPRHTIQFTYLYRINR